MSRQKRLTVIIALIYIFIQNGHSADWPCWRGPNHNGISTESGWDPSSLKNNANKLWSRNIGQGYSSISIQNDKAIAIGNKDNRDTVYCLNTKTGKEIWKFTYKCPRGKYPGPRSTPAIDENSVYTLSREGHLFCLDLNSGEINWQQNVKSALKAKLPHWGLSPSPRIENNLLLVQVGANGAALDKKTGQTIWSSPSGKATYSSPVIFSKDSKKFIAVFGINSINGVDLKTGRNVWSIPWKTKYDINAADPIVFDNFVFVSSGYGKGCSLIDISKAKPKIVWKNKKLSTHTNGGIMLNKHIYGFSGDLRKNAPLTCIDTKTGMPTWTRKMGSIGSLIAADNKLIILNEKGKLFIVQASSKEYKELSSIQLINNETCWTAPSFSHGSIFCRSSEGTIVCFSMMK